MEFISESFLCWLYLTTTFILRNNKIDFKHNKCEKNSQIVITLPLKVHG